MSLDNTKLLDFLGEVDKELSHKIVVVAVGGTNDSGESKAIQTICGHLGCDIK
jgi:hypothetical protein